MSAGLLPSLGCKSESVRRGETSERIASHVRIVKAKVFASVSLQVRRRRKTLNDLWEHKRRKEGRIFPHDVALGWRQKRVNLE